MAGRAGRFGRAGLAGLARAAAVAGLALAAPQARAQATGDLGVVVERATGSLLVIDRSERAALGRIEGLGDLSHASLGYSPDERGA